MLYLHNKYNIIITNRNNNNDFPALKPQHLNLNTYLGFSSLFQPIAEKRVIHFIFIVNFIDVSILH